MTLVRPGFAQNVMSELTATGYPVYRATSGADLMNQAAVAHGIVIIDEASFAKMTPEVLEPLPTLIRGHKVKLYFIPEHSLTAPAALDGLVTSLVSSAWTSTEIADALSASFNLNQRGAPRAIVTLTGTMTINGEPYEGTLLSLSEGGALFSSNTLPHVGAKGHLVAEDVEGDGFSTAAVVVSERRLERGVGLRFEPDPDTATKIRTIVSAALGVAGTHAEQSKAVMLEGNELVRRATTHLLAAAGFAMRATASPAEFVKWLGESPAELVLIDPGMPAAGGDRLKEFIKRSAPATVFLFTNAADSITKKGIEAGATGVIKKGTFTDAFISRVTSAVQKAKA